jgi:hypothetical protein
MGHDESLADWELREEGKRPARSILCDKVSTMQHPIHRVMSFQQTAQYTLRVDLGMAFRA